MNKEKKLKEAEETIKKFAYKNICYHIDLEVWDLIQECNIAVLKKLNKYRKKDFSFLGWVFSICEETSKRLFWSFYLKRKKEFTQSYLDSRADYEKPTPFFEKLISEKKASKNPLQVFYEKEEFDNEEKKKDLKEKERNIRLKAAIPFLLYENSALDYIFKCRFGKKHRCPKCDRVGMFYRVKKRKCYACVCGYQIHPLTNTIFHKSSTKLSDWLFTIYLLQKFKNKISIKEIERQIKVTYKTAWRMVHIIRKFQNLPEYGNIFENLKYTGKIA